MMHLMSQIETEESLNQNLSMCLQVVTKKKWKAKERWKEREKWKRKVAWKPMMNKMMFSLVNKIEILIDEQ